MPDDAPVDVAAALDADQVADDAADDAPAIDDLPLEGRVEALLLSTERGLTEARLAALIGLDNDKAAAKQVLEAIEALNEQYDQAGRAFRLERLAGGWQFLTRAEYGDLVKRLHADKQHGRLTPAALETLSIVAYRQPILRAEIEAIRGVASGEVLRGLMERRLVKITGRAEILGRPMLYGTTSQFLNVFGLASLDDLPAVEGLERKAAYVAPKPEKTVEPEAAEQAAAEQAAADAPSTDDAESSTDEAATMKDVEAAASPVED